MAKTQVSADIPLIIIQNERGDVHVLEKITSFIMGRSLSTLISGGILLLIAPLIIQFIWTAITYKDIEAFNILVQEENDIALILIAIGSFFLGRRLLYS